MMRWIRSVFGAGRSDECDDDPRAWSAEDGGDADPAGDRARVHASDEARSGESWRDAPTDVLPPPRRSREDWDRERARDRGAGDEERSDAEGPVDLSRGVEANYRVAAADRLADTVTARALRASREGERPFLAEVARKIRARELALPPMPDVVVRLQRLIDSTACNLNELAAEVETEPALATRLVGIANSPYYAGLGKVQTPRDAVVRIGLGETRNIVMAIMLRSKVFRVPGFDTQAEQLWRHAITASVAGEVLAAAAGEDPDAGFLIGLIHDIGRIVLLSMVSERARSRRTPATTGLASIRKIDGELHAALGALTADAWQIDRTVIAAIGHHHDPEQAPPPSRRLAHVARCADLMAHRISPRPPEPGEADPFPSDETYAEACAALELDAATVAEAEREVANALAGRMKSL